MKHEAQEVNDLNPRAAAFKLTRSLPKVKFMEAKTDAKRRASPIDEL